MASKGDYVCEDGANGGVHSQLKITQTDVGVTGANGQWRPITDHAVADLNDKTAIAGVNGDSGSPIFAGVNNFTADEARGTLTTFDNTVSCDNTGESRDTITDGDQRDAWCFNDVYYVPIRQTLADMNWTLVTSS
ncbi:hypothetical protein AAW14_20560 [Streptomyces hygroscopicus]|nr:hypothetical protein [Streptomyces hygroscopicus]